MNAGPGSGLRAPAARTGARRALTSPVAIMVAIAAALWIFSSSSGQAAGGAAVEVRDNEFGPVATRVMPGDTVTWTSTDSNGHTVTADHGQFSFHPNGRTLGRGESVSWTVPAGAPDGYVHYYCARHGLPWTPDGSCGMCGVIVVGNPPPSPPPPTPPVREVPSAAFPTINSAVTAAPKGTIVRVAPGIYEETVTVGAPGVTIRGTGPSPADVRITGEAPFGVAVFGNDARIENLTVDGFGFDGISVLGAERTTIRDVVVAGNGRAGVRVHGCAACGTLIWAVIATENAAGVLVDAAGAVVINGSTVTGNGSGIVIRSSAEPAGERQLGSHVVGNVVGSNNKPGGGLPSGVGIWIAGGAWNLVEDNTVTGHDRFGIAVSASQSGAPATDNRVTGNAVTGSGRADVATDGLGTSNCFSENRSEGGGPASFEPAHAQPHYDCAARPVLGMPWPPVTAALFAGI